MNYTIITPRGYVGASAVFATDQEAVDWAREAQGENVLDITEYGDGLGLVVADEVKGGEYE
jgi:hypothetical protein